MRTGIVAVAAFLLFNPPSHAGPEDTFTETHAQIMREILPYISAGECLKAWNKLWSLSKSGVYEANIMAAIMIENGIYPPGMSIDTISIQTYVRIMTIYGLRSNTKTAKEFAKFWYFDIGKRDLLVKPRKVVSEIEFQKCLGSENTSGLDCYNIAVKNNIAPSIDYYDRYLEKIKELSPPVEHCRDVQYWSSTMYAE